MTARAPIPFRVLRYRCPTCPRTASSKARMTDHIGRCWTNPDARGCKTCRHFRPYGPESPDWCANGVSLAGQVGCQRCYGTPDPFGGTCPAAASHDGDGREIKSGPIVGCDRWQQATDCGDTGICPDRGECTDADSCRLDR